MRKLDMWELKLLQGRIRRMYFDKDLIVSVDKDKVNVTHEVMADLINTANAPIKAVLFNHGKDYHIEFWMTLGGTKFFSLMSWDEVRRLDLIMYVPMEMREACYKWWNEHPRKEVPDGEES